MANLMSLEFVNSLVEFEFARIAFISTLLVSLITGVLSPIIVLKEKSYIGDILAHLVFPGIIGGYFLAAFAGLPLWACLVAGAAITAFVGQEIAEFFRRTLNAPTDATSVVTLTGFFAAGVVVVSRVRGTRIDLERILFGDVLTLSWDNVLTLGVVLVLAAFFVMTFRKHWDAWIADPEFAEIAGFKVKLVSRMFPVLVTLTVLTGIFAVGSLMISALLVLPSLLITPASVVSLGVIGASLFVGLVGFIMGFQLDWPVGPCIVIAGLSLVLLKALVVKARH